jgi:hypothetical protein
LAALAFIAAAGALAINVIFAAVHLPRIVADDQKLNSRTAIERREGRHHQAGPVSDEYHESLSHRRSRAEKSTRGLAASTLKYNALSAHRYRRLDIRNARDKYFKEPYIAQKYDKLPKIELTVAQISLIGPILIGIYFFLAGRLARRADLQEWLRYAWRGITRVFVGGTPAQMPPTPAPMIAWAQTIRPWLEGALALLFLIEIASSIVIAKELGVWVFGPTHARVEALAQLFALLMISFYFLYDWLVARIGPLRFISVSPTRRAIVVGAPLVGIILVARPAGSALASLATRGHFSNPRYRRRKRKARILVTLPHGLYRNPKTGKIFYVDLDGRLSCRDPIKTERLIRISSITEANFPHLTQLAAKICFEKQALSALKKGQLRDSIPWLELGARYELYRRTLRAKHKINVRVVKLFAGLCYRHRMKGRIPQFRRQIAAANLIGVFQPSPQNWLGKASDFKYRWRYRKSYDQIPLLKV